MSLPALPIRTERLELRLLSMQDLDVLYAFHSHPVATRYLYWGPRDREQTREALEKRLQYADFGADGSAFVLAVEHAGKVIGEMTLRCLSKAHRQGEIGFLFDPDHQGRGYATEATRAVLDLGFSMFGFRRIVGCCDARNAPSYQLMERVGMRREAHFVENELVKGEWTSELVYALLAAEWMERGRRPEPAAPGAG